MTLQRLLLTFDRLDGSRLQSSGQEETHETGSKKDNRSRIEDSGKTSHGVRKARDQGAEGDPSAEHHAVDAHRRASHLLAGSVPHRCKDAGHERRSRESEWGDEVKVVN